METAQETNAEPWASDEIRGCHRERVTNGTVEEDGNVTVAWNKGACGVAGAEELEQRLREERHDCRQEDGNDYLQEVGVANDLSALRFVLLSNRLAVESRSSITDHHHKAVNDSLLERHGEGNGRKRAAADLLGFTRHLADEHSIAHGVQRRNDFRNDRRIGQFPHHFSNGLLRHELCLFIAIFRWSLLLLHTLLV